MITDITKSLFPDNRYNKIIDTFIQPASIIAPILPIIKAPIGLETIPSLLKSFYTASNPGELIVFILFSLTYKGALRWAHKIQVFTWHLLALGIPLEWEKSMLGFMQDRAGLLGKLMGFNYIAKLACKLLIKMGFRIRPDFPTLLSRVSYAIYIANFIDLFKGQFLRIFFPSLAENRRQSYVVNRSSSVAIWVILFFVACEMVSTYLKVPLSSTLALGGVGGLALGLSARDIAANFLGGMLLLFNEPFVPGDMVTFKTGSSELIGRVERVGWGQTRIRGRDTRPTYVPNSHFVQTAVTNMERITHRKFEAIVPLRFQDQHLMQDVLMRIKDALRTIPKLDVLSMPFRVSFVKFGQYSLDIEITCFFATKSIDEFLALQQIANLEILKVIRECGAQLALPTSNIVGLSQQLVGLAQMAGVPPQNEGISQTAVQQMMSTSPQMASPQMASQTTNIPQQSRQLIGNIQTTTTTSPGLKILNKSTTNANSITNPNNIPIASTIASASASTIRNPSSQPPSPSTKLPPPLVPPPIGKSVLDLELKGPLSASQTLNMPSSKPSSTGSGERKQYNIGRKITYNPDNNVVTDETENIPTTEPLSTHTDILADILPPLSGTIFSQLGTVSNQNDSNYLFKTKVFQGQEIVERNKAVNSSSIPVNIVQQNNKKTVENPPRNTLYALEQEFFFKGEINDDDKWIEKDTTFGEW